MRIVLIGPPACGKGTVGRLLSSFLKLPLVSVGTLLRAVPSTYEFYNEINVTMSRGDMVDSSLVGSILAKELESDKFAGGYILDGWLRQRIDFTYFDPDIEVAIYINIPAETVKQRILNRRVCSKCDATYNLITKKPKSVDVCDLDGYPLKMRLDDTLPSLERRIKFFESETKLVLDKLKKEKKLIEVDGKVSPEQVFELTKHSLAKYLKMVL